MPPIAGLRYFLDYYMLVLFATLNFQYEFGAANQPGFEPGSPGPIMATLTIGPYSIDPNFHFFIGKANAFDCRIGLMDTQ